jgi:hypothetical protein
MSGSERKTGASMSDITDRLAGARNVLLAAPAMGEGRDVCTSLLVEGVTEPTVLFVTYTRQPEACVAQLDQQAVGEVGVITVADTVSGGDEHLVSNVSTPSDLTGLGIQIGQFLSERASPVVVCFDSLTSLLQYVDYETAYEFLHAVTGQVYAADARAHFHIDPVAHDEQHVAGIASLFDARVEPDGELTVHTRDLIN